MADRYLIVGGGMTGDAAAKGIREHDADGSITLVGSERHPPYARPPLSKKLWTGGEEETIWRGTERDRRRPAARTDDRLGRDGGRDRRPGRRVPLRAAPARDRRPPAAAAGRRGRGRLLPHARRLPAAARPGRAGGTSFVVIGGGFIGSEIAAALAQNDCDVTIVVPDAGICARLFPPELSDFVTQYYRDKGVEVVIGERVGAVENGGFVRTESGKELRADGIVAGLGIEPATELAASMGLSVENGIVVDELGRAADERHLGRRGRRGLPASGAGRPASASSTRTTRRPTARRSARTWPAPASRTSTCRSSTPTCSTSGTRRSATWTRGSDRRALGRAEPQGRHRLRGRRRKTARLPALGRLGQGRRTRPS